jgi:hypothetical protein
MQDLAKLAPRKSGARALLGWSQAYLAEGVNARCAAIADFENCKHQPHAWCRRKHVAERASTGGEEIQNCSLDRAALPCASGYRDCSLLRGRQLRRPAWS